MDKDCIATTKWEQHKKTEIKTLLKELSIYIMQGGIVQTESKTQNLW